MNSLANGKIIKNSKFKNIYISKSWRCWWIYGISKMYLNKTYKSQIDINNYYCWDKFNNDEISKLLIKKIGQKFKINFEGYNKLY